MKLVSGWRLVWLCAMLWGLRLAVVGADLPPVYAFPVPEREAGQRSALAMRCEPLEKVRVAFVGVGARGLDAVRRFRYLSGAETVAVADVAPENLAEAKKILAGVPGVDFYDGAEDWKIICRRDDVDLVYICTPWDLHAPLAVYAMEHGKHVAVEVPAALTIEECWQLVDTSERTRRHCMMLENCNYDFFELTVLNMAQQGVLGEIVHVEGAYIHDLRDYQYHGYWNHWRYELSKQRNGCLYPTHGIGPVAHVLNIHRGDRMERLVSISTGQFGMSAYAAREFPADSRFNQEIPKLGDMNTTLIHTANGKTMLIQHDVTSPRPYDRRFLVSGTGGFAQKYPVEGVALEPNAHAFLAGEAREELFRRYEHPFSREIGEEARRVGGHGGMDFIMDYRLIYCLNHGLPLDQDVYDAAEWSSLVELSQKSIELGNAPVEVPDFTRGDWKRLDGVHYYSAGEPDCLSETNQTTGGNN